MNTWFTSDFHFNHSKVVEYCNRPWTAEDQTEALIARWNDQVEDGDEVYHLGDFFFGGINSRLDLLNILSRLKGKKFFITGNHCDHKLWSEVPMARKSDGILSVSPYMELRVKIGGRKKDIILSHFPFHVWNKSHYGSWHLHGHMHGTGNFEGRIMDVGIDTHPDFRLYSLNDVAAYMKDRPILKKGDV